MPLVYTISEYFLKEILMVRFATCTTFINRIHLKFSIKEVNIFLQMMNTNFLQVTCSYKFVIIFIPFYCLFRQLTTDNTFISSVKLQFRKNEAKVKQHLEAEFSLFYLRYHLKITGNILKNVLKARASVLMTLDD